MECPRCGARKSWALSGGRHRCARCRFDWKPGRLPLRLSRTEWRALLSWFVRGVPSAEIANETGLERKRVLRALKAVREAIQRDNPVVDADSEADRDRSAPHRRPREATIGLFVARDLVGAEVVSGLVHAKAAVGYSALVERGRLHRLESAGAGRVPFGQIEAFWSYLQRHLRSKGGIRASSLPLYLAEFVWRYNHRKLTASEQAHDLLRLLGNVARWNERDNSSSRKSGDRHAQSRHVSP